MKGNYEVKKFMGKVVVKVVVIIGVILLMKFEGKWMVRKCLVKKEKWKEIVSENINEMEELLKFKGKNGCVKGGKKYGSKGLKVKLKERWE